MELYVIDEHQPFQIDDSVHRPATTEEIRENFIVQLLVEQSRKEGYKQCWQDNCSPNAWKAGEK
jgi:hypothetical protein